MNKHFRLLFFLLSFFVMQNVLAQNNIEIRLASFGNGDAVSVNEILKYPYITLINRDADVKSSTKLVSYDCVFNSDKKESKVCKNQTFVLSQETIISLSKLMPGEDFVIKNIIVEVVNVKTGIAETLTMEPVKVRIAGKNEGSVLKDKIDYVGKLITGKNHDEPVTNQKVILQNKDEVELQTTITDSYGDFKFTELDPDNSYKINVLLTDDTKIKDGQLYAAKPDGTIIKTFIKTKKGFVYELLSVELNSMAKEKEEDTELAIKKFSESKEAELTVIEDIYYDLNSAEITIESVPKIDKIINAMNQNKALKLSINSHTDSKGDDAYNMTLSEKRAQNVMKYFITKGIDRDRLKAKGLGETQIKNRCKNNIDCSEMEHQLNRRTEFQFTK
jgi:outer membrane protein OmpA-like peptidoglycan-associated protein